MKNDKNENKALSQTSVMVSMAYEEKCNLIAEELKLCMGFDVEVFKDNHTWKLRLQTIAGTYIYTPSEPTYMGDVFRFISNYGDKLQSWGLSSKIAEYKY
jgi:hypothetical protein